MSAKRPSPTPRRPRAITFWHAHLYKQGSVQGDCPALREYTKDDLEVLAQIWEQACQSALRDTLASGEAAGGEATNLLGNLVLHKDAAKSSSVMGERVRQDLGWGDKVPEQLDPGVAMGQIVKRLNEWAGIAREGEIDDIMDDGEEAGDALAAIAGSLLEHSPLVAQNTKLAVRLLGQTQSARSLLRNPLMNEEIFQGLAEEQARALSRIFRNNRPSDKTEDLTTEWKTTVWKNDLYREAFTRNWHMRQDTVDEFREISRRAGPQGVILWPTFVASEDLVSDRAILLNLTLKYDNWSSGERMGEWIQSMRGKTWLNTVKEIVRTYPAGNITGIQDKLLACGAAHIAGIKPEDLLFLIESETEAYRQPGRTLFMVAASTVTATAPAQEAQNGPPGR